MSLNSKLCFRPLRTAATLAALSAVIGIGGGLATSSATQAADATEYGYVTSPLALPTTNLQTRAYARDIDGDGQRDNALGQFFATVASQGLDFQSGLNDAIARGDLLMLHSLRTPSLANTKSASWQVLYAEPTEEPDFSGFGSFNVDSTALRSPRLPTTITDHHVKTAAGTIPVRLYLMADMFELNLKKGKVFATCSKSSCSDGRINGAITAEQVNGFISDLAEMFTPIVARDCPQPHPQPCADGTDGKALEDLFDADHDRLITAQEIRENSLVGNTLAPDLDLVKANGKPGHDGVEDALSAGFGFDTVRAQLKR